MPRINAFNVDHLRPPRYQEMRTVVNPADGQEDTLLLRHLDEPLAHLAIDVAGRLVMQYVGSPDDGIKPIEEFSSMDGLPVILSESLCRNAANFFVMQGDRPDGADIYTPIEIICFALYHEAFWKELQKAANAVNRAGDEAKNASRAAAGDGSTTPLNSTRVTPKLSNAPTGFCGALTEDSPTCANTLPEIEPVTR